MMNRRKLLRSMLAGGSLAALPCQGALGQSPGQSLAQSISTSLRHRPTIIDRDILAVTGSGQEVSLAKASVQALSDQLKSHLLLPGLPGYDQARLLINPSFDKRPALVVQPTGPADVSSAVSFAREHQLLTAVKCGGHSASGKSSCDGGLQIDLSQMRGVRVDPKAQTARVEGGSLLGELDHEAMAHGLVTTAGTVSHTGVGGLTLGGGFGRLGRRFGMTIDNLLEMDVVTPDGQLRRAAPDENPDLYWALRGGGGNFGVVTSFLFRLHPMQRTVVNGRFSYPFAQAKQILNFFAEHSEAIPDEMAMQAGVVAPPGGAPAMVSLGFVWSGEPDRLDDLVKPFKKAGKPVREVINPMDYVALQRSGDSDDPRANGAYQKSGFLGSITSKMVDDMVDNFRPAPNRVTWFGFQQSGGAIGRVANSATAFAHREAKVNMIALMAWKHGSDPSDHIGDIQSYWDHMEPHTQGFYSNDLFAESQQEVSASYRENYPRLARVKQQYDPTNLFRLNANIRPGKTRG